MKKEISKTITISICDDCSENEAIGKCLVCGHDLCRKCRNVDQVTCEHHYTELKQLLPKSIHDELNHVDPDILATTKVLGGALGVSSNDWIFLGIHDDDYNTLKIFKTKEDLEKFLSREGIFGRYYSSFDDEYAVIYHNGKECTVDHKVIAKVEEK